jgi:hypothetical protein
VVRAIVVTSSVIPVEKHIDSRRCSWQGQRIDKRQCITGRQGPTMNPTDITAALAAEHDRDLLRTADRNRLVALARCCRPAALAAAWRRLQAWIDHGQLRAGAGGPCRV